MPLLVEDNGAALKTPVQYLLLGAKAQDVEDLCSGRPGRAAGIRPTSATQRQPQGQPAADPRVEAASGAWDPAANGRAARAHAHSLPGAPSAQTQERTCWTSAGLSGNSSFASGVSSTRWPETCGGCSSWRTRPPATSSLRKLPTWQVAGWFDNVSDPELHKVTPSLSSPAARMAVLSAREPQQGSRDLPSHWGPRPSHADSSPPQHHGEVGWPHQPGQAAQKATGCPEGDEPLAPLVSALEPPSSWATGGAECHAPVL